MDRWLNKTAVVTGAGSGIGKAIALALLRNGVNVIAVDIQKEGLAQLDKDCKQERSLGKLHSICCDLADEHEIEKAFSTIESLGGIDIMVNCAGICYFDRIIECDRKTIGRLLNVNVLVYAVCMTKAVRSMRQRNVEGHIFNMNSVLAHHMYLDDSLDKEEHNSFHLYSMSKHTSRILTTSVRREIAAIQAPIRVTSISPGAVNTDIGKHAKSMSFFDGWPRIEPEDVANVLIYALGTRPGVQITELTIQPTLEKM